MSNIIDGLIKGVSGFLPQDDPDVKILTAQAELREFPEKEEKIFARLGRAVYDTDGGESHPEIKTELEVLFNNRYAAEERLQAARDEKILREKAEAEERARREAEEAAHSCPNCGAEVAAGYRFCSSCGTQIEYEYKHTSKEEMIMAFCTFCGTQVPDDIKFCTSCGKPMGITATIPTPAQQVQPQAPPVYAQPQTAPPPQQAYTAPPAQPYAAQPYAAQPYAPAPDPNALPPGSKYEPITTGGYIGIMLLMMLPIVNLILLLVWACGGCRKVNKTNFARAMLIIMLISAVLSGIIFLIFGSMFGSGLSDITDTLKSLE